MIKGLPAQDEHCRTEGDAGGLGVGVNLGLHLGREPDSARAFLFGHATNDTLLVAL